MHRPNTDTDMQIACLMLAAKCMQGAISAAAWRLQDGVHAGNCNPRKQEANLNGRVLYRGGRDGDRLEVALLHCRVFNVSSEHFHQNDDVAMQRFVVTRHNFKSFAMGTMCY